MWEEYVLDQEINDRGIRLDMPFVENAVQIDALTKEKLTGRLKALTGLENPNSVLQMKAWLKEQGVAAESLDKKSVMALLTTVQSPISDVLMLRQQLAKIFGEEISGDAEYRLFGWTCAGNVPVLWREPYRALVSYW